MKIPGKVYLSQACYELRVMQCTESAYDQLIRPTGLHQFNRRLTCVLDSLPRLCEDMLSRESPFINKNRLPS